MNVRRTTIYPRLAAVAGERAGLLDPTPERVAENPAAREVRDALWAEYERRLADKNTWTLAKIQGWLRGEGVSTSLSQVARDRRPILDHRAQPSLIAAKVREYMAATKNAKTSDVLEAARRRSADLLFEHLLGVASGGVEDIDLDQLRLMARAVAALSTADAQTQILQQRLAEMRAAFDRAVASAAGKRKDKRLTSKDVDEVRKAVFGSAA
ncbi:MAG TPA: phage protein Gp27 family protein [Phycisphaerae bacterium]|nr:phage protein Gp27 family protein [Phycisphaerae bacterium]